MIFLKWILFRGFNTSYKNWKTSVSGSTINSQITLSWINLSWI